MPALGCLGSKPAPSLDRTASSVSLDPSAPIAALPAISDSPLRRRPRTPAASAQPPAQRNPNAVLGQGRLPAMPDMPAVPAESVVPGGQI